MILDLDQAQQAVCDRVLDGPPREHLRVDAAAGAGKSHMLTRTTGEALARNIPPHEIIATTFTRKAADELVDRMVKVHPAAQNCVVGTYHAIALQRMRSTGGWNPQRCVDVAGWRAPVPGTPMLWTRILGWGRVIGTELKGLDLEVGRRGLRWNDYALAAEQVRALSVDLEALDVPDWLQDTIDQQVEGLFERFEGLGDAINLYARAKRQLRAWDFRDLLDAYYAKLTAGEFHDYGRYVFVDEAQDNDLLQLLIALYWARVGKLILVGDARQSIYRFRSAFPEFFIHAPELIGAEPLSMPTNYRSGKRIVELGNEVVSDAPWFDGDAAVAHRELDGTIRYTDLDDVAEDVQSYIDGGKSPSDIALLCRTNATAGDVEARLLAVDIPVQSLGRSFFSLYAVQDFCAYAVLIGENHMAALDRIRNRPKRFLGQPFLEHVDQETRRGRDFLAAMRSFTNKGRKPGREIASFIEALRSMSWSAATEAIRDVLMPPDAQAGMDISSSTAENLRKVCEIAKKYSGPLAFLSFVEHAERNDKAKGGPKVTVGTVHSAKGKEWPVVYVLAGKSQFPHPKSEGEAVEEERRLMYVAVTRARDELTLVAGAIVKDELTGLEHREWLSPFLPEIRMGEIIH